MHDELDLIRKAQEGDRQAFGLLVRRYQDRLFSSVMHVVQHHDEAEDIVQDAFVKALTHLSTFQAKSSFYTWIYRIAFNAAVNRQRRRGNEKPRSYDGESPGAEPSDPGDGPGDRLARAEQARVVQHALQRLGEPFRAVLVLREIDGFDYETISQVLGISVGTVRSRLHRARQLMRDQLSRTHLRSSSQ